MDTNKKEKQEGKGKMKVKGKCLGNKILEATRKGEGETQEYQEKVGTTWKGRK